MRVVPQAVRPSSKEEHLMGKTNGFTKAQVREIGERDGWACAWLGYDTGRLVPQHRANRGMGGRRSLNRLSNGLLLDSLINGLIESDADYQAEAIRRGIKISLHADPTLVPVLHAVHHGLVFLTDDGAVVDADQQGGGPK